MKLLERARKVDPVLIGVLILAGILLFTNIASMPTWRDEAQVLSVSRNLLTAGVPTAWDGKQYVTQPADYEEHNLMFLHSWLEFYVIALAYKVFGMTLAGARTAFAIFGLLSVLLTYTLAMVLFKRRATARIAAILLATNVVFLLHARQARYYVLAVFFVLAAIHAYLRVLDGKKWGKPLFVAAAVGLFHSNWFTFFVTGAFLALDLTRRTARFADGKLSIHRTPWLVLAKLLLPVAALTLPLFLFLHPYSRGGGGLLATLKEFAAGTLAYHGLTLSVFVFPIAILAGLWFVRIPKSPAIISTAFGLVAGLLVQAGFFPSLFSPTVSAIIVIAAGIGILIATRGAYGTERQAEAFLWQTVVVVIALVVLLASQFSDIRYILYTVPLIFILAGRGIDRWLVQGQKLPLVAAAIVIALVASNAAPWLSFRPLMPFAQKGVLQALPGGAAPSNSVRDELTFHSPLAQYWQEAHTVFIDGPEASCRFIQKYGKPGQTVLTTRDVWGLSFTFYCPGFIVDQPSFAQQGLYVYEPIGEPDWVIMATKFNPAYLENYTQLPLESYQTIFTVFEETSRPEPWLHTFTGRDTGGFTIFGHRRVMKDIV